MPATRSIDLPVRWDLSMRPDGTATLTFTGELDAISTPQAWSKLETEFAGSNVIRLEVMLASLSATARDWPCSITCRLGG